MLLLPRYYNAQSKWKHEGEIIPSRLFCSVLSSCILSTRCKIGEFKSVVWFIMHEKDRWMRHNNNEWMHKWLFISLVLRIWIVGWMEMECSSKINDQIC
jgi:hypothetical protein